MDKNQPCPEPEVFVDFLTGKLQDEQLQHVEEHLAQCDACGDTVRSMHVEDTFVNLVSSNKQAVVDDASDSIDSTSDTALRELMVKLESMADSRPIVDQDRDSHEDLHARVREVESLLAVPQTDNEIGRLAHYRVLKLLGAGGMGVVYQAEDTQLRRLVALKVVRPSLGRVARERFLQEARAAAAIEHDNVVTIYNVGSDGPLAYLAMQWLDGETLEDRLRTHERLSPEEVIEVGSQIADGLAAAHAKKLIHRDIKPANIWLEAGRDRARILDFGLARVVDDNPQLTETGMIAGTPAYMSPEQAQGRAVDERSDLFSLGTLMYRMLTGTLPFEESNALATIRAIQQDTPPAPRQVDLNIPVVLSDSVMDLLEKDTRSRPETAEIVAESLRSRTRPVSASQSRDASSSAATARPPWTRWIAFALLFAGLFAAPIIYRVATDYGEIVVESAIPDVKVEVTQGGETVTVVDTSTGDTVKVRSGTYQVQLKDTSQAELNRDTVTINREGQEIVKVLRIDSVATTPPGSEGELKLPEVTRRGEPINAPPTIRGGWMLKIHAAGTMPDWPINAVYSVEPSGQVSLGPMYGRVLVAGMTPEQAEAAITNKLKEHLKEPRVSVIAFPQPFSKTDTELVGLDRFDLKYVTPVDVDVKFFQLFPNSSIHLLFDERTNSLLATGGTPAERQQLRDFLETIDRATSTDTNARSTQPAALYEGQPYEYWLNVARIEKSVDQVRKAIHALGVLTDSTNSKSTCEIVFRVLQDRQLEGAARGALIHCDPDVVSQFVMRALRDESKVSRPFLGRLLVGSNTESQLKSFSANSQAICQRLMKMSDSESTRDWAHQTLSRFCAIAELEPECITLVTPTLIELLVCDNIRVRLTSAWALARHAPDTKDLAETVVEIIEHDYDGAVVNNPRSSGLVNTITQLGPRMKIGVPPLLKILSTWISVQKLSSPRIGRFKQIRGKHISEAVALIEVLRVIGPEAKEALPLLRDFTAADVVGSANVKQAAQDAIARIEGNRSVGEELLNKEKLADCELHVVGIYSPKDHNTDDRVYIEIQPTDKPIVLTLCSYFAASWQLKLAEDANVKQVIVSSAMGESLVTSTESDGLPDDLPVLKIESSEDRFWAYSMHSSHGRDMIKKLDSLTNLPIASFQGRNSGRRFTIDGQRGRLEASETVLSAKGENDHQKKEIVPTQLADCKLHVVGIYGPKHSNRDDRVQIEVKPTEKPIVLTLSSYESVNWQLQLDEGARIKQVIIGSYFPTVIEGLPDDVPVAFYSYFPNSREDFFFGYAWHSAEGRKLVKRVKEITNLTISTFQGVERGSKFTVDGIQGLLSETTR